MPIQGGGHVAYMYKFTFGIYDQLIKIEIISAPTRQDLVIPGTKTVDCKVRRLSLHMLTVIGSADQLIKFSTTITTSDIYRFAYMRPNWI